MWSVSAVTTLADSDFLRFNSSSSPVTPEVLIHRSRVPPQGSMLNQSNYFTPSHSFCLLWDNTRLSLWSSGQSYWLQIQRHEFDSGRYQIFWEAVGLERGPLSLVNTIEELLGRKSSRCGLENRECCRRDPLCWPRNTLYPQKVDTNFADKLRSSGRSSSLAD
jgi:hypothetical protein